MKTRSGGAVRLAAAVLASACACASGFAQDFPRIAPKEVIPPGKPAIEEPREPRVPAPDTIVRVKELKGVVFVMDPKAIRREGVSGVSGVDVDGIAELQTDAFRARMSRYLGKPVSLRSIEQMINDVVAYYTSIDRPFVVVTSPEQDITGGVLQLLVLEGRVGEVRVSGAQYFGEKLYRDALGLRPGDPIRKSKLDEDIDWINRNPFRSANVFFEPGKSLGTTDVTVRTNERRPFRVYAGFDDTGTRTTDQYRMSVGANWGNVFGLDHQLNYQFTADPDVNNYKAHSATYIAPLPWRHLLTVFGAYADVKGNVPQPFNLTGHSHQIGLRYEIPLARQPGYTHSLIGGIDYKRTNTTLEFGGLNVSPLPADIFQGVVSYQGTQTDMYGSTSMGVNVYLSPGGITSQNTDVAFQTLRAGSHSDYTYGNVQLQRVTRLPADFAWHFSVIAQLAGANLLGSEQLGAGGYTSVRGYDEREANGDQGAIVRNELRTPGISLGSPLPGKPAQIQFLTFVDYGKVSNKHLLPGEASYVELLSAGLGLRFAVEQNVTLRFDYGWQLRDDHVVGGRNNSRPHFALLVAF